MSDITCTLAGCDKPLKRAGFCYSHYMKNWRYGTPTPTFPSKAIDLVGQRFGALTVRQRVGLQWLCDCDCGATTTVAAGDLNRGSAATCGDRPTHARRDDAGYGAAHERLRRDNGPASDHPCADCGDQARHWSYNHNDPDELHSQADRTTGIAYSLKADHYSPRCVPCHKRFDLDRIDAIHIGT